MKILFVCLGNICRSPTAEGIFKSLVQDRGLTTKFFVDSAGTSAYHVGEPADSRMMKFAKRRGYNLTSKSRKLLISDLEKFDYILAMDSQNLKDINCLDKGNKNKFKIKMITDFSTRFFSEDVPDPYYGGDDGFNRVIDILEESCNGFFNFLNNNHEI